MYRISRESSLNFFQSQKILNDFDKERSAFHCTSKYFANSTQCLYFRQQCIPFNPFQTNVPFLYTQKTFSGVIERNIGLKWEVLQVIKLNNRLCFEEENSDHSSNLVSDKKLLTFDIFKFASAKFAVHIIL